MRASSASSSSRGGAVARGGASCHRGDVSRKDRGVFLESGVSGGNTAIAVRQRCARTARSSLVIISIEAGVYFVQQLGNDVWRPATRLPLIIS